jgi:hypothetical protein
MVREPHFFNGVKVQKAERIRKLRLQFPEAPSISGKAEGTKSPLTMQTMLAIVRGVLHPRQSQRYKLFAKSNAFLYL